MMVRMRNLSDTKGPGKLTQSVSQHDTLKKLWFLLGLFLCAILH